MWRWRPGAWLAACGFAAALAWHAPGQAQDAASAPGAASATATVLRVVLADGRSREFTRNELERLPRQSAAARLRDGAPFNVNGVSVTTLLREAGLDLSERLGGGQVVRHALVARAADGYRAVFGLAEVDPHFAHPPVIVNWANADGSALEPRVGPLQLIATGESRPGRWVRQLISLEVKAMP